MIDPEAVGLGCGFQRWGWPVWLEIDDNSQSLGSAAHHSAADAHQK